MRKFVFYLFAFFILVNLPLQARGSTWSVFEPETLQESIVTVSDAPDMDALTAGGDDRKEITGNASVPERAVVVVEVESYTGKRGDCSGTMVGPRTVLTAAHCLSYNGKYVRVARVYAAGMPVEEENPDIYCGEHEPCNTSKVHYYADPKMQDLPYIDLKKGLEKQIKQRVENQAKLSEQYDLSDFPHAASKQLWVPNEYLQMAHEGRDESLNGGYLYDYGIIVLDEDLGTKTGWLGLKAGNPPNFAKITVVGRGGDKPEASLWESSGRIVEWNEHYIFHNAYTRRGNSGSPIFTKKDPKHIIGIHSFGGTSRNAPGGVRITEDIINALVSIEKDVYNTNP